MTPLPEAERIARLRLARTDKIGPVTFFQLLQRFGTALEAIERLPDLVRRSGRSSYVVPSLASIEDEMAAGARTGAKLIVLGDITYPARLAATEPPPPALWAKGNLDLLGGEGVAIVGARIASAGGQRIARGLAQQLGEAGYIVFSGMARGIDTAAHVGSLSTGTVAVLGGGIDDIYPPENAALYEQIAATGCILTENIVGARAQARDFPRRNRIISGLSRGVVVVEAEMRSGSLITARLAAEQGRDVFAVPGSPLDPRSRGTNDLLRNGAIVCEGFEDIERAFTTLRPLFEPEPTPSFFAPHDDISDEMVERIANLLSPTPTPRDEIARALDLPAATVSAALLELSLMQRASLLEGGLVSL